MKQMTETEREEFYEFCSGMGLELTDDQREYVESLWSSEDVDQLVAYLAPMLSAKSRAGDYGAGMELYDVTVVARSYAVLLTSSREPQTATPEVNTSRLRKDHETPYGPARRQRR